MGTTIPSRPRSLNGSKYFYRPAFQSDSRRSAITSALFRELKLAHPGRLRRVETLNNQDLRKPVRATEVAPQVLKPLVSTVE